MSNIKIDINDPLVLVPLASLFYLILVSVVLYFYSKLPAEKRGFLVNFILNFLSLFLLGVKEKNDKFLSKGNSVNIHSRTYMRKRYGVGTRKIIVKAEKNPNLIALVDKEFANANLVRNVFINVFVIFTLCIIATYLWLDKISLETKVVVGVSYLSFSLFNIFIIKSSYRRTAMLLSIMEDSKKQSDIGDFMNRHRHGKDLSDNDIELIRMMYVSRAERERTVEHPYELFMKNVNGATINFGKGSVKVEGEKTHK
ncbi:hypothetical protein [Serratia marcescens]|uniref:hypothetical protein n=1 Tax=Serratia marcescens TaxID=615 RepID=UPI001FF142BE|nr:hypothetical protein [Serratia marcescens]MCK1092125.1 hypothetical protein [Serratia marcescens]